MLSVTDLKTYNRRPLNRSMIDVGLVVGSSGKNRGLRGSGSCVRLQVDAIMDASGNDTNIIHSTIEIIMINCKLVDRPFGRFHCSEVAKRCTSKFEKQRALFTYLWRKMQMMVDMTSSLFLIYRVNQCK